MGKSYNDNGSQVMTQANMASFVEWVKYFSEYIKANLIHSEPIFKIKPVNRRAFSYNNYSSLLERVNEYLKMLQYTTWNFKPYEMKMHYI